MNPINHDTVVIIVKAAVESIPHLIPFKNMVPEITTSIDKLMGDKTEKSTYNNICTILS